MPTIDDFEELALRVGTVTGAELHPTSREPAIKLWIDFGPLGERQSSAKVTDHYQPSDLMGRQIVGVTGFPAMRVGGFRSDVLVLGALAEDGVVLLNVDAAVPPGSVVG